MMNIRLQIAPLHYIVGIPFGIILFFILWRFVLQSITIGTRFCGPLDPSHPVMDGAGGAIMRAFFGC